MQSGGTSNIAQQGSPGGWGATGGSSSGSSGRNTSTQSGGTITYQGKEISKEEAAKLGIIDAPGDATKKLSSIGGGASTTQIEQRYATEDIIKEQVQSGLLTQQEVAGAKKLLESPTTQWAGATQQEQTIKRQALYNQVAFRAPETKPHSGTVPIYIPYEIKPPGISSASPPQTPFPPSTRIAENKVWVNGIGWMAPKEQSRYEQNKLALKSELSAQMSQPVYGKRIEEFGKNVITGLQNLKIKQSSSDIKSPMIYSKNELADVKYPMIYGQEELKTKAIQSEIPSPVIWGANKAIDIASDVIGFGSILPSSVEFAGRNIISKPTLLAKAAVSGSVESIEGMGVALQTDPVRFVGGAIVTGKLFNVGGEVASTAGKMGKTVVSKTATKIGNIKVGTRPTGAEILPTGISEISAVIPKKRAPLQVLQTEQAKPIIDNTPIINLETDIIGVQGRIDPYAAIKRQAQIPATKKISYDPVGDISKITGYKPPQPTLIEGMSLTRKQMGQSLYQKYGQERIYITKPTQGTTQIPTTNGLSYDPIGKIREITGYKPPHPTKSTQGTVRVPMDAPSIIPVYITKQSQQSVGTKTPLISPIPISSQQQSHIIKNKMEQLNKPNIISNSILSTLNPTTSIQKQDVVSITTPEKPLETITKQPQTQSQPKVKLTEPISIISPKITSPLKPPPKKEKKKLPDTEDIILDEPTLKKRKKSKRKPKRSGETDTWYPASIESVLSEELTTGNVGGVKHVSSHKRSRELFGELKRGGKSIPTALQESKRGKRTKK